MRRQLRARAARAVRRSGLLPATWPDRLGEETRLADVTLHEQVVVYFPDTRTKLYQLRQWYAPLRALHARHPVVVIGQDSRAMATVREESGLTALTLVRADFVAALLSRSDVKVVLYVNHASQNFAMLRFPWLAHVYLSHGDSDKGVSVSNQVKAYDFCLVAGQAAIDRLHNSLLFEDLTHRLLPIGRPELDAVGTAGPGPLEGRRARVLYAPTWEGGQPSMEYGSAATHGEALVRALVSDGGFSVSYRPHPLSGFRDPEYGAADRAVRELITEAQAVDPAAGHTVDTTSSLLDSFATADLLVCDVSSVAIDWLATGRPLVVTRPPGPEVETARTRLLDVVPRLDVADLPTVTGLVRMQLEDDPSREARRALVDYYLGDTAPGAATRRFLDACSHVIELRDKEWSEISRPERS